MKEYIIEYREWAEGDPSIIGFSAQSRTKRVKIATTHRKGAIVFFRKWKKKNKSRFNTKVENWGGQRVISISEGSWSHARLVEIRKRKTFKKVEKVIPRT